MPGSAPAGTYQYRAYVGSHPNTIYDSTSFAFTKSGVDDSGGYKEWRNTGEAWDEILDIPLLELPHEFALEGAYPNPFNPVTTIRFAMPRSARVNLTVYDISGRSVATLVHGWRDAGHHEVQFDASGLASGVYLYRLETGNFNAVGKALLLK